MPTDRSPELIAALRKLARAAKRLGKYPDSPKVIAAVQDAFSDAERVIRAVTYRNTAEANSEAARLRTRAIQAALEECPIPPDDPRYPGWMACAKLLAAQLQVPWPPFRDERPARRSRRRTRAPRGAPNAAEHASG